MSLTPSFTIGQNSNPAALILTDTSTGSDVNVVDRTININKSDGTPLTGPIDWPIAQSSITITPLDKDYALDIIVTWNNSSGIAIYTVDQIFAAVQYAEKFYYGLTQQQSIAPSKLQDQQYFENKSILRTLIDSALQAISVGVDLFSAQVSITEYQQMMANPTLYF